jgi:hypothetical protein
MRLIIEITPEFIKENKETMQIKEGIFTRESLIDLVCAVNNETDTAMRSYHNEIELISGIIIESQISDGEAGIADLEIERMKIL